VRVTWRRRHREERGAIIPMVAMLLVVLVPSSAMAVDLGMQRVVRRDMQTLADVVALDAVRLVDGRTASEILGGYNGLPTLTNAVSRSVARNDDDVLGDAPTVTATLVHIDTATGKLDRVTGGAIRVVTGVEVPNAVQVTARGAVNFAFLPGRGPASRTAVAVPSPSACFRLGSFAVGVDSSQASLLNQLLPGLLNNSTISGTLVGYQGLAAADVSLLDLVGVAGLGVGTPDELLRLDGLTVNQFYAAMATVLQNHGGPLAAITLLQSLSTSANLTRTIAVKDLLGITTADSAALAASFDILDLVTGAAYLANGDNTLLLPDLAVQLPVLNTGATISLKVGEAPKLACGAVGKAKATTGQVDLKVTGTVADTTLNLGLGRFTVQTGVSSRIFLAGAEGTLTNIVCGAATASTNAEGIDVQVSSGLVSDLSVSANIHINATLVVPLVGTVTVDLSLPASTTPVGGMTTGTVSFRHPTDDYGVAKRYGSSVIVPALPTPSVPAGVKFQVRTILGLNVALDIGAIPGLGDALGQVLSTVVGTLNNGLVSQLNTNVAPFLAQQLGVTVGGADVFAMPRPSCNDPGLAG
jgi:uncharacterized membrane protein